MRKVNTRRKFEITLAITVYVCACVLAWVLPETDGTLKLGSLVSI